MHGYNGVEYIKQHCITTYIVFVQEHWLKNSQLYMFNSINDQFMFYGKSAMDESMSSGLIKGRTYEESVFCGGKTCHRLLICMIATLVGEL